MEPIDWTPVTQETVEQYDTAHYEVVTIAPLVEAYKNVYHVTQDELTELLEGYEEYAEFIVSVKELLSYNSSC